MSLRASLFGRGYAFLPAKTGRPLLARAATPPGWRGADEGVEEFSSLMELRGLRKSLGKGEPLIIVARVGALS